MLYLIIFLFEIISWMLINLWCIFVFLVFGSMVLNDIMFILMLLISF